MTNEIAVQDAKSGKPGDDVQETWELARQWRRLWRYVKWAATAGLAIMFLLVVGQGFLFYRMFAEVHPWLGIVFVALLALLIVLLVGRPLLAFFRTPVVASAPDISLDPKAPKRVHLVERLSYDLKFLKALRRHPDLTDEVDAINAGMEVGRTLLADIRKGPEVADAEMAGAVMAFEMDHIERQLKPLDAKVDKLIHSEAVAIGIATAVSMNGTVDAFIVLWRSANLVAKISRIYFGRPNLRGSLIVMRDVAGIVVLSRALEDVTDMTGDLIGSLLGRMGGLVAGPVMDGAINAMMALKLGSLTKRRCRSFRGWQQAQARSISAEALGFVKKESASVVAELMKACGGLTSTAAKATESVMAGSKNAWSTIQSWFGVKGKDAEA